MYLDYEFCLEGYRSWNSLLWWYTFVVVELRRKCRQSNLSKIYNVQDQFDHLYQGSLDLSAYYTCLITLWEELKNFEELPSCTCGKCTCGSNDRWIQLYERRNIVCFLMRLNESFAQARRKLLWWIQYQNSPRFTTSYLKMRNKEEFSLMLTYCCFPGQSKP